MNGWILPSLAYNTLSSDTGFLQIYTYTIYDMMRPSPQVVTCGDGYMTLIVIILELYYFIAILIRI